MNIMFLLQLYYALFFTNYIFLFFRFLVICYANLLFGVENKIGNIIQVVSALISFAFGIMSAYYGNRSFILLLCMGREEAFEYDFKNTFKTFSRGVSFNMRLVHPFRISFNIVLLLYVIFVPFLYYKIFKYRKEQAITIQG